MKRTCQCAHITSCIYTEDFAFHISVITGCRSLPKVDIDRGIWFIVRGFGFQLEGTFRYMGDEDPVSLPIEQYFGCPAQLFVFLIFWFVGRVTCCKGIFFWQLEA